MKKLMMFALVMVMVIMAIGCGETAEDTKWIDEAASKIDKDITSGQFVIDGVVYEFPMDLQYWLDNGWHISNNYDNVDQFKLEPDCSSSEFELFNDKDGYVKVTVLNTSDEDAKVMDCMVYSVKIDLSRVDAVLPQGVNKRTVESDIESKYGKSTSSESDNQVFNYSYNYETKDEWKCVVSIDGVKSAEDQCQDVKYYIMSFDTVWEKLVDEKGEEEACKLYVDAAMNASFTGDYSKYVEYCIDTKAGAQELYDSEINYYSECLIASMAIEFDYVDEATKARFDSVAKKVLSKVVWEVQSVEKKNAFDCKMNIKLYPTNFLDIVIDDVTLALQQLMAKYQNVDIETMSDEDYEKLQKEYIDAVLVVLEKKADVAATKDAVTKTYEVDLKGNILSNEAWSEIDDIIMDMVLED